MSDILGFTQILFELGCDNVQFSRGRKSRCTRVWLITVSFRRETAQVLKRGWSKILQAFLKNNDR